MLKVGSPQSQANQDPLPNFNMGEVPTMNDQQFNDDTEIMDNEPSPIESPNDLNDTQFDNDFDAGIDADEEKDPRRYIEQLTGKLSKKLYDFIQKQPDSELCKYVMGMIAAQATKGLSEEDAQEIIKKIESGEEDFDKPEENQPMNDKDNIPNGDENGMNMEESINHNINELFQDLTTPQTINQNIELKKNKQTNNFKKRPFTAPNFQ